MDMFKQEQFRILNELVRIFEALNKAGMLSIQRNVKEVKDENHSIRLEH